jgi:hypothetical protein
MNIKFYYLYRDASNYKNYNEIIFQNSDSIDLKLIEMNLKKLFIDSQYFEAKAILIPELYFESKNIDDHDWHEFLQLETTTESVTDSNQRSIIDFINDVDLWRSKIA